MPPVVMFTPTTVPQTYKFNPVGALVAPNTAVTVSQFTALTAGSAVLWAEIWGS